MSENGEEQTLSNGTEQVTVETPGASNADSANNAAYVIQVTNFADYVGMVPQFSGNDTNISVGEFFEKLEYIANLAGWDDAHTLAAARFKLSGEADKITKSHPECKNARNIEVLKSHLIKRFGKVGDCNTLAQFTRTIQGRTESTRGFLSRLSCLAHKCIRNKEMLEELLFSQALKGLNSASRRFVMLKEPKTFDEIWQAVLKEEECLSYDIAQAEINVGNVISKGNKENSEVAEIKAMLQQSTLESDNKIKELTQQVTELTKLVSDLAIRGNNQAPPNPSRRQIICFNCGMNGHISRFCRRPRVPNNNNRNQNTQNLNQ